MGVLQVTHNALNQGGGGGGGGGGQYPQGSPYIGGGGGGGGMNPYASPHGGIAQGMQQMGGNNGVLMGRLSGGSSYMHTPQGGGGGGGGGLGMQMNVQMQMAMQYNTADMTTPNSTSHSPYGQYQAAAAASVSPYVGRGGGGGGGGGGDYRSPQGHPQQRCNSLSKCALSFLHVGDHPNRPCLSQPLENSGTLTPAVVARLTGEEATLLVR